MASPNLPTNIAATYPGNAADPSIKAHQQAHDTVHAAINKAYDDKATVQVNLRDWDDFRSSGSSGSSGIAVVLNQALTQAAAAGGAARVLVPKSTTSTPLVLDAQITLQSGVTVEGSKTKLKAAPSLTGNLFRGDVLTDVALRNLDIDGNATGASGLGVAVYITNSAGVVLEDLSVHDSAGNSSAINVSTCTDVVLRKVKATHGSRCITLVSCPDAVLDNVYAAYGRSFTNTDANLHFTTCDRLTIRNTRSTRGHSHGSYFASSDIIRVVSSRFNHNGVMGINLADGTSLPLDAYTDEGWRRGISMSQGSPCTHLTLDGVMLDHNQENGCIIFGEHPTIVNSEAHYNNLIGAVGGHGFAKSTGSTTPLPTTGPASITAASR